MKNTSLTKKIVGIISVTILLFGFVFISLFLQNEARRLEESTQQKIRILAEIEASVIACSFNSQISVVESQVTYLENLIETKQTNREVASCLIKKVVLKNSTICSAWAVLEKSNFDGKDHKHPNSPTYNKSDQFTCWWHNFQNGKLTLEPLTNFEQEKWYVEIKGNKRITFLEPYTYPLEDGTNQLFLTIGQPIIIDSIYFGITGNEMSLEHIQKTISEISVFDGDYACLISPKGIYAAHPNINKIGKPVKVERFNNTIKDAFAKKKPMHTTHISHYLNKKVFDFYIPIKIKQINNPWYLRVSVPTEIIQLQIIRFRNNLTLTLLGIVLLVLIILYLIIYYALRPVSDITNLITQLSSNGVSGAIPIKIKTNDEIGQLGTSYNRLLDSLTEKRRNEIELEAHRSHLELLVKKRTEAYMAKNDELNSINKAFHLTNEKLNLQKEELEESLQRLKEAQSQLLQAEKMASLGILTAGVAHEINNPLNYILGSYVGLKKYFKATKTSEKKIDTLLSSLKTGIDKASDIINGLNQFSRINENFDENCDIHTILNNCLLMLHHQLKDRIIINKKFCTETILVSGNAGKLHQVFLNVLVNSLQAIENEGAISIITQTNKKNAIIEISDTGYGISNENLSKVTDPFFTTKDPGKGTGLGLSITYSIVKEHKGKLEFKSEQYKGTIITTTLPLKKEKNEKD